MRKGIVMGDIVITSHYNPFRMSLKERKPIQLFVELHEENRGLPARTGALLVL